MCLAFNNAQAIRRETLLRLTFAATVKILLDTHQLRIVLYRLAHQLIEAHGQFEKAVLVGIQPRGVAVSDRLVGLLAEISGNKAIPYATLDATFYRDDLHQGSALRLPSETHFPFAIEGKTVVLIDDVLFTGRTIRAAMDALLDLGRPEKVELLALVDRRFSRQLPVQPDYSGFAIDTYESRRVRLLWGDKPGEDVVYLEEAAELSNDF